MLGNEQNIREGFGKNVEVCVYTASGEEVIKGDLKETEFPYSIEIVKEGKNYRIPYFGKEGKIKRITNECGEILYQISQD